MLVSLLASAWAPIDDDGLDDPQATRPRVQTIQAMGFMRYGSTQSVETVVPKGAGVEIWPVDTFITLSWPATMVSDPQVCPAIPNV
jgi:hypothetical protein